jgi:hypothetical protein
MRKLSDYLTEDLKGALVEPKSASSMEAKKIGLQYVGFGRYMNPESGQVTYIVQNDRLIPFNKAAKTNTFAKNSGDDFGSYVKNLQPDIEQHHANLVETYLPEEYDDTELDTIHTYTESSYFDINETLNALPTGIPADQIQPQFQGDSLPDMIAALDSATNKITAPYDFITWTGLSSDYKVEDFAPGRTFQFKGFRSTTLNPNIALNFNTGTVKNHALVLQLNIKKGSKGIYADEFSATPGESEFILPRGTKVKIKSGPHILQGSNAFTRSQNMNLVFFVCDIVK